MQKNDHFVVHLNLAKKRLRVAKQKARSEASRQKLRS
jgi:hypothetical protein